MPCCSTADNSIKGSNETNVGLDDYNAPVLQIIYNDNERDRELAFAKVRNNTKNRHKLSRYVCVSLFKKVGIIN